MKWRKLLRRFTAATVAGCMALSLSMPTLATTWNMSNYDSATVENTVGSPQVVKYNGNTASEDTDPIFSGSTSGTLTLLAKNQAASATLQNAEFDANSSALYINSNKPVTITLVGSNKLQGGSGPAITIDGQGPYDYQSLILQGSGTLDATGYGAGIYIVGSLNLNDSVTVTAKTTNSSFAVRVGALSIAKDCTLIVQRSDNSDAKWITLNSGISEYVPDQTSIKGKIIYLNADNSVDHIYPETSIQIDDTNFPDPAFRKYVSETYDPNGTGFLSDAERYNVTSINVRDGYNGKKIDSLQGIENFPKLESLDCSNNQLSSLDVSKNTNLETLYCSYNQLTSLKVSGLTNLTLLSCYDNQLTSLDVSGLTNLHRLYCGSNRLTSLDVSGLTNLSELSCNDNKLTSLDVSCLTNLSILSCGGNQLTSLNVNGLTSLGYLSCSNNALISLDVSGLTSLRHLYCGSNQLTGLDVNGLTNLTYLSCGGNLLTSLNVNGLTILGYLSCGNNKLTSLNVSGLTSLNTLYCRDNQLTSLDVSGLTNLTSLDCGNNSRTITLDGNNQFALNQLPGFDPEKASGWTGGTVENGVLTVDDRTTQVNYTYQIDKNDSSKTKMFTLNVTPNHLVHRADDNAKWEYDTDTHWKWCWNNDGTKVEEGKHTLNRDGVCTVCKADPGAVAINEANFPDKAFREYVSETYDPNETGFLSTAKRYNVTDIDVTNGYKGTKIGSLQGIENFPKLETLECNNNQLTSLDLSRLTSLGYLSCSNNALTSLDVSGLTHLTNLDCSSNQLTSLKAAPALEILNCGNNQLTSLDLSGLAPLLALSCSNNQLISLNVNGLTSLCVLSCNNNQLTSLDVSGLTSLNSLDCSNNQLTSLDVNGLTNLIELSCNSNQLTSLDVNGLTSLRKLYCRSNSRTITLDGNNQFTLSQLPGFDPEKASGWTGGIVENGVLTVDDRTTQVNYTYQIDKNDPSKTAMFTLNVTPNHLVHRADDNAKWEYDTDTHWKWCWNNDGTKVEEDKHTYVDGACSVCGYKAPHVHTADTEWHSDATSHWHECTAGDGAVLDKADHDTKGTDGACSVCGYKAPHVHTADTEWHKDETSHWHECTAGDGAVLDKADHDTKGTDGACSVCGYKAPHVHTADTEWHSDATHHWHECTAGDGAVLDKETHDTLGEGGVCSICGYLPENPDVPGGDASSLISTVSAMTGGALMGGTIALYGYTVVTELVLHNLLPEGAEIPENRIQLAELVWQTAGRPQPVNTPAFADLTDPDAAAAAQWCVEQGLLKTRADGSFDSGSHVFRVQVIQVWRTAFPQG